MNKKHMQKVVEDYLYNSNKNNLEMPRDLYYFIIYNYDRIPCEDTLKADKFTFMKEGNDPKVSKLIVYPKIKKYRGQTAEEFFNK